MDCKGVYRSLQEYIQQIGRIRNSTPGTICLSILCDPIFCKLYSLSFNNAFSEKILTRFIHQLQEEAINGSTIIPFQKNEQKYNLPESIQRTLLILLENHGLIHLDMEFCNHYVIIPYNLSYNNFH